MGKKIKIKKNKGVSVRDSLGRVRFSKKFEREMIVEAPDNLDISEVDDVEEVFLPKRKDVCSTCETCNQHLN